MKTRSITIVGSVVVGLMIIIAGAAISSPSINSFDDFVYQLKEPFDGAEPEQTEMINTGLVAIPSSREFLKMDSSEVLLVIPHIHLEIEFKS